MQLETRSSDFELTNFHRHNVISEATADLQRSAVAFYFAADQQMKSLTLLVYANPSLKSTNIAFIDVDYDTRVMGTHPMRIASRLFCTWLVAQSLASFNPRLLADEEEPLGPHWLAASAMAVGDKFSYAFQVDAVQSARLRFAGDYCRTQIFINGTAVAAVEPYCQTLDFDVTDAMRLGENRLELQAEPIAHAPAAIAFALNLTMADGQRLDVESDPAWKIISATGASKNPTSYGAVSPELWGIGRRSIAIDPFENYEQWQQAKGGGGKSPHFFVAPGFEITQLRVAQPDEGSWVSLASDGRGRFLIGREDKGFLRMTITDDATSVNRIEPIESDLLECRGLVYMSGWFYASANNSKQIVRFQLSDEARITDLTTLREFPGGVGHGRNDLSLNRESLLLICGDSVDPPTTDVVDRTSPLRKSVADSFTREGSLLRSSLDGQRWELLCAGLRNPYGIATHPQMGDPFTYDADNEYDLGMPWYRPTRILQLVTSGDYGYREATSHLPPRFSDQADNAPPLLDIGRGSPTAVIFGDRFIFTRPYRDALYALDWTYGRILAIHLEPRGATFRAATELFLQGKPLNVTDVAAGHDGAMYLITGGRKTQSALYRVAMTQVALQTEIDRETVEAWRETANNNYSRELTTAARQLQKAMPQNQETPISSIVQHLASSDPVVRYSARTALERFPADVFSPVVLGLPPGSARLQGLLAVARTLDASQTPMVLQGLDKFRMAMLPIGERLVWLRILDLCFVADPEAVKARSDIIELAIVSGWQISQSPRWQISVEGTNSDFRRRAALLLQKLGSPILPQLAARDLLSSPVQEDRIAGLMALRKHENGWDQNLRELQLETLAGMPQMTGGEGLPAFHAWLERETLTTLTEELKTFYAERKAAILKPEPLPPARPLVQKWTLNELRGTSERSDLGDAERGKQIFDQALCSRCHRFAQRGAVIGPDLTSVAGRFSRHDILDSILNPSKAIAENYRAVTIHTIEGKVVTGRVIPGGDFRSEKLRLIPDLLHPDQVIELDKKSIEEHLPSDQSPMPQGLLDGFSREEIADLLAYLTRPKR